MIPKLPGAPLQVVAVPSDGKVTVSWKEPTSSGTSAIKSYKVYASVGRSTCSTGADGRSCTVTGLKNGTRYYFTVRARNGAGYGKPGLSKRVIPGTVPGVVRDLVVKVRKGGSVLVDWNKPASNGGVPVTGYVVTYTGAGGTDQKVTVKDTQASVTGLTKGTSYTFTVVAKNAYGPGTQASVSKTP